MRPSLLIAFIVLAFVVGFGIVPFVFMLLWNLVMPSLFGLPQLAFWHAFAIVMIVSIVGKLLK